MGRNGDLGWEERRRGSAKHPGTRSGDDVLAWVVQALQRVRTTQARRPVRLFAELGPSHRQEELFACDAVLLVMHFTATDLGR